MIFDLTFPIENGMPFYPGDPEPKIEKFTSIEKEGYVVHKLTLGTHTGTHVDVPAHFIPGGKTVDQIEISKFSGKAYVISVEKDKITKEDIPNLNVDILLIYTGSSKSWKKGLMDKYSIIDEDAAREISKRFKLVGIDSPSIGSFETHKILLENEVIIVENLANLDKIKGKYVDFLCFPLLIKGVDGSPARAIAVLR